MAPWPREQLSRSERLVAAADLHETANAALEVDSFGREAIERGLPSVVLMRSSLMESEEYFASTRVCLTTL